MGYLLVRCLLGGLMVLARREVSKDAELLVLRHENAVLRRQTGQIRYQPGDRLWLAALSRLIPRRRWGEVFAVTPATLLAWHRRLVAGKWDYTNRRPPGRPSLPAAIRKLVIRIATDNAWGYRRVQGELVRLGHQVAGEGGWRVRAAVTGGRLGQAGAGRPGPGHRPEPGGHHRGQRGRGWRGARCVERRASGGCRAGSVPAGRRR